MAMGWVHPWVGLGWVGLGWLGLGSVARLHAASAGNPDDISRQISGREELARYKALQVPTDTAGPLEFWRQQASDYPVMLQTARRVLAISASSAQLERDFSSVGHTLTDLRTRLSAHKVESIELVRWGKRAGLLPPM